MSALDDLDEAMALLRRATEREQVHDVLLAQVRPAIVRLLAERDGWRAIANELLKVAIGEEAMQFDLPPLEIMRDVTEQRAAAALDQFWSEVTLKYERRRAQRAQWSTDGQVPTSQQIEARRDEPDARAAWLRATCGHCGAAPGEPCRTSRGQAIEGFHGARGRGRAL